MLLEACTARNRVLREAILAVTRRQCPASSSARRNGKWKMPRLAKAVVGISCRRFVGVVREAGGIE